MAAATGMEERDLRLRRTREAMEQANLDALIVAGREANCDIGRGYFRYFTDYHLWGHDGLVLIPLDGDPVATATDGDVAEGISRLGWIREVYGDPEMAREIALAMEKKGLTHGEVGIVGWKYVMPVGAYEILKSSLPEVEFVDADKLLDRVRMVKSPLEIQQNRDLWELARLAMDQFVEVLEPGKTQIELAAEVRKVLAAGGCRDSMIWVNGDLPPKNIPVDLTDVVDCHVETPGPSGHWCELTVTCAFRDPTASELRLMESELLAYEEICEVARPGATVQDLVKTFERVLSSEGWEFVSDELHHNQLHGQGLDPVEWPVWGPLVQQDMVIEEGMVFNYHPHRWVVGGVRDTGICDNIVITEGGAERLSGDWDLRWRIME